MEQEETVDSFLLGQINVLIGWPMKKVVIVSYGYEGCIFLWCRVTHLCSIWKQMNAIYLIYKIENEEYDST